MDDLVLIGGVISICVVLAITIISIFQTKDRRRTDGRERLRNAFLEQWRRRRDCAPRWRREGEGLVRLGMSLVFNLVCIFERNVNVYAGPKEG